MSRKRLAHTRPPLIGAPLQSHSAWRKLPFANVKVLSRQEAEKVYEAMDLLVLAQYRHRVVVGIFKKLLQLIMTGNMPYGTLLG